MKTLAAGFLSFYAARIRANWLGFLREFWPYIVAVSLAASLDFLSTYRFMALGGVADELHPIIRMVSYLFGPLIGPLVGKLGQLAAIFLLTLTFRRFARIIFIPTTLIYLYAAWFNTWGVDLYTPFFLRLS